MGKRKTATPLGDQLRSTIERLTAQEKTKAKKERIERIKKERAEVGKGNNRLREVLDRGVSKVLEDIAETLQLAASKGQNAESFHIADWRGPSILSLSTVMKTPAISRLKEYCLQNKLALSVVADPHYASPRMVDCGIQYSILVWISWE